MRVATCLSGSCIQLYDKFFFRSFSRSTWERNLVKKTRAYDFFENIYVIQRLSRQTFSLHLLRCYCFLHHSSSPFANARSGFLSLAFTFEANAHGVTIQPPAVLLHSCSRSKRKKGDPTTTKMMVDVEAVGAYSCWCCCNDEVCPFDLSGEKKLFKSHT